MIDNILISLSFVFLVRNMNSNEINDLTFKSDRLLDDNIDGLRKPKFSIRLSTSCPQPQTANNNRVGI